MGRTRTSGQGRPKGAKNKATIALETATEKARNSGLMPLDFMLELLRTEDAKTEDRKWAAVNAAPYLHPKLANVDIGNKNNQPFQVQSVPSDKKLL